MAERPQFPSEWHASLADLANHIKETIDDHPENGGPGHHVMPGSYTGRHAKAHQDYHAGLQRQKTPGVLGALEREGNQPWYLENDSRAKQSYASQGQEPSLMDRTRRAIDQGGDGPMLSSRGAHTLLNVGHGAAEAVKDIAMQPFKAGDALGDALHDPSIDKFAHAGLETGLATLPVGKGLKLIAGSAVTGGGNALDKDFDIVGQIGKAILPGSAQAAGGLSDAEQARFDKLGQQRQSRRYLNIDKSSPDSEKAWRAGIDSEHNGLSGRMRDYQKSQSDAEIARGNADADETRRLKTQTEDDKRTHRNKSLALAQSAYDDAAKGNDGEFSKSNFGQWYNKSSPALVGGVLGGMVGSIPARAYMKEAPVWARHFALPAVEGAAGSFVANEIPSIWNSNATPAENPQLAKLKAYVSEAPADDPRRLQYESILRDASLAPNPSNPVHAEAKHNLETLDGLGSMALRSAASGAPLGIAGSAATYAPGLIARGANVGLRGAGRFAGDAVEGAAAIPGHMQTGVANQAIKTAEANGRLSLTNQRISQAQTLESDSARAAAEVRSAAAEAQRRSGAGTGSGGQSQGQPERQPPVGASSGSQTASEGLPVVSSNTAQQIGQGQGVSRQDLMDAVEAFGTKFGDKANGLFAGQQKRLAGPTGPSAAEKYVMPMNGSNSPSQADAARAVYRREFDARGGNEMLPDGRNGGLGRKKFLADTNAELERSSGLSVDPKSVVGETMLDSRRIAYESAVRALAEKNKIPLSEAMKKYEVMNPTKDASGNGNKTLKALGLAGASGVTANALFADDSQASDDKGHWHYQPREGGRFTGGPSDDYYGRK